MHLVRRPWGWDGEAAGLDGGNILYLLEWQANILCPYLFGSGSIPLWFNILDGLYQGISFNVYWEPLVAGTLPGIGDAEASLWWSMSQTPGRHTKDTQSTKGHHSFNMFIKHQALCWRYSNEKNTQKSVPSGSLSWCDGRPTTFSLNGKGVLLVGVFVWVPQKNRTNKIGCVYIHKEMY